MTTLNDFNYVNGSTRVKAEQINRLIAAVLRSEYKNLENLAATRTLLDADTPLQRFDCNGAHRIVKMPTANATENHPFLIYNSTASGTYTLTIQNNGGTISHAVLAPSEFVFLLPDGNGTYVMLGRPSAPGMTALTPTTADVTATLVTGGTSVHRADISGLTANRNFILPAGTLGDRVELIVTTGDDTYCLILKGDTSITINGGSAATEWSRLRISGEKVFLIATSATNWQVEMDGRIPNVGAMSDTNAQNIDTSTLTKVTFDTANANIGNMVDLPNDRIVVWRAGVYRICAQVYYHPFAAGSLQCNIYKNGSATGMPASEESTLGMGSSSYGVPQVNSFVTLAAGDVIELYGRQNSGSAQNPGMKPGAPALLNLEEILS